MKKKTRKVGGKIGGTIAFDLDGTLIGHTNLGEITLRPQAEGWIKRARRKFRKVILWTLASRGWYDEVSRRFPLLLNFDAVVTREDWGMRPKDVRAYHLDCLVDNDPMHREWAIRNGGDANKYVVVNTWLLG
jgi:FMN phosphatase YigB (HAD superfamily)